MKLSKVVVVGVTTHTMCFNCYCHQHNGCIKPYQRLAKRRRAIRCRSRSGLPFKYRFETFTVADKYASCCGRFNGLLNFNSLFFFRSLTYRKTGDGSGSRQIRNTPDWSDNAVSGDHLWVPTSVSGDCCYVGDNDCTVSSRTKNYPRMRHHINVKAKSLLAWEDFRKQEDNLVALVEIDTGRFIA